MYKHTQARARFRIQIREAALHFYKSVPYYLFSLMGLCGITLKSIQRTKERDGTINRRGGFLIEQKHSTHPLEDGSSKKLPKEICCKRRREFRIYSRVLNNFRDRRK